MAYEWTHGDSAPLRSRRPFIICSLFEDGTIAHGEGCDGKQCELDQEAPDTTATAVCAEEPPL